MKEVIRLDHLNIQVQVPNFVGRLQDGKLTWLKHITDEYFEASIRLLHEDGYLNFIVKVNKEMNLTPISNSNYYSQAEVTQLTLAEKLNLSIHDTLMERRVKELL